MLVGLISDSHNHHVVVRRAVDLLDTLGVAHIIHCGDVGGMRVFDELIGHPCTFVWGNTDLPGDGLLAYLAKVGFSTPNGSPTRVELGGRRFAVFHGHESGFAVDPRTLDVDYILHGHTHQARDERVGAVRVINPGALHRVHPKTVATLETTTDTLTFHRIA